MNYSYPGFCHHVNFVTIFSLLIPNCQIITNMWYHIYFLTIFLAIFRVKNSSSTTESTPSISLALDVPQTAPIKKSPPPSPSLLRRNNGRWRLNYVTGADRRLDRSRRRRGALMKILVAGPDCDFLVRPQYVTAGGIQYATHNQSGNELAFRSSAETNNAV